MTAIGAFLSQLRKEQGLTQAQLGERLRISNKTISRWETGTYMPPVEALQSLSELYGVSINEILSAKRLSDIEYRSGAEENVKATLQAMDPGRARRIQRVFMVFMAVSTGICIAVTELVSRMNASPGIRILVIVLVLLLTLSANTLNLCLLVSENEKWK